MQSDRNRHRERDTHKQSSNILWTAIHIFLRSTIEYDVYHHHLVRSSFLSRLFCYLLIFLSLFILFDIFTEEKKKPEE